MSNFLECYPVNGGMPDTARRIYSASTNDLLSTVIAANYLDDKVYTVNNATGDLIANGPLQTGDTIFLKYDVDGTPGYTVGYVSNPSTGVYNFVVGIPGVAANSLLLAKKVVNGATFAGGAALVTITDAAILTTDVVVVSVNTQANAEAVLKVVPGAGSIAVTFAGDPGSGTMDYVAYATV